MWGVGVLSAFTAANNSRPPGKKGEQNSFSQLRRQVSPPLRSQDKEASLTPLEEEEEAKRELELIAAGGGGF